MAQATHIHSANCSLATGSSAYPPTSLICAAHAEFVAALSEQRPLAMPLHADVVDLADRADYLETVLSALSKYLTVILDDTAQNVPSGLDLRQINALLSDLASEVRGTLQQASECVARRVA